MRLLAMAVTAQGQTEQRATVNVSSNILYIVAASNGSGVAIIEHTIKQSISRLRAMSKSETVTMLRQEIMNLAVMDILESLEQKLSDLERKIEALKVPQGNPFILPYVPWTNGFYYPVWTGGVYYVIDQNVYLLNSNAKEAR
jgi:hypothetical protein